MHCIAMHCIKDAHSEMRSFRRIGPLEIRINDVFYKTFFVCLFAYVIDLSLQYHEWISIIINYQFRKVITNDWPMDNV